MLNDKSCMLDSLLILLDIPVTDAIAFIGHDGSERGFHSQEIIDLADHHGYAVTEIQRRPVGINPKTYQNVPIEFLGGNDRRFAAKLHLDSGIVMGSKMGRSHAVAWDGRVATDPSNRIKFRLVNDDRKIVEEFFVPLYFLRLNRYD